MKRHFLITRRGWTLPLVFLCALGALSDPVQAQTAPDRATATRAIRASTLFLGTASYTIGLPQGGQSLKKYRKKVWSRGTRAGVEHDASYRCLERGGHISIVGDVVTLTQKGRAIGSTDREPDGTTEPLEYTFRAGDRLVFGITRINSASETSAVVLYEWRFDALFQCMTRTDETYDAKAILEEGDDGWEVKRMYHEIDEIARADNGDPSVTEDLTEKEVGRGRIGTEPTEDVITQLVIRDLKRGLPVMVAHFIGTKEDVRVTNVTVLEMGEAQDNGTIKFWTVKVYVEGSYHASTPFEDMGRKEFKAETEYNIYQNPYADWEWTAENTSI